MMTEEQAVAGLKAGDMRSLQWVVEQHQARALRVAFLLVRDLAVAEDIVQDVLATLLRRIRTFDAGRPFAPWFFRCVEREALSHLRQRRRRDSVSLDAPGMTGELPLGELLRDFDAEAGFESAENLALVRAALDTLSPAQRSAVVRHYLAGYGINDIAADSGSAAGTVKRHLFDARARLRTVLQRMGYDRAGRPEASAEDRSIDDAQDDQPPSAPVVTRRAPSTQVKVTPDSTMLASTGLAAPAVDAGLSTTALEATRSLAGNGGPISRGIETSQKEVRR